MYLILIVLILLAVFGLPQLGGHYHQLGWAPSGIGFVVVIILVVLLLSGRL